MSVAIIDAEGDYGAVIVSGANLRLPRNIRDALEGPPACECSRAAKREFPTPPMS